VVDGDRLQALVGTEEQPAQQARQQTGCRPHGPKRTSAFGQRDIERMHVGLGTGGAHDRSGATDMIGMTVTENQMLELLSRTTQPADSLEDGDLLARQAGVDQRQPVVALDQERVYRSQRDGVHAFDHALHGITP